MIKKDMINVALVGMGRMGHYHFQSLAEHPQFRLRAVVDPFLDKTKQLPLDVIHLENAEGLAKLDIDCIVVATPSETHYRVAKELLSQGYHVLVEKPATVASWEAKEIVSLARAKKLHLAVGHIERCNPVVELVQKVLDSGFIGEPIHCHSLRAGPYPGNVHKDNNVIIDLAVHELDVMGAFFGSLAVAHAHGRKVRHHEIFDMGEILAQSSSGPTALIHVNWLSPYRSRNMTLIGTEGVVHADYIHQECDVFHAEGKEIKFKGIESSTQEDPKLGRKTLLKCAKQHPINVQLAEFYKMLTGQPHRLCTEGQLIQSIQLLEDAQRSLKELGSAR
jgi:UDP-N-acetylglucosamine 3-dehydrogenase